MTFQFGMITLQSAQPLCEEVGHVTPVTILP
jgi:hypothetical protein